MRDRGSALPAPGDAFTATDWLLLAIPAVSWGSSFVLMAEALEQLAPTVITLGRVVFGALALALVPGSYARVPREDLGRVVLLGIVWIAVPFLLFPIAQQWIDSSLAGMLNGAVPLWAALVAAVIARRIPPRQRLVGLAIGLVGVVLISLPSLGGQRSTSLGIALVLLATVLYGFAINLATGLQRRHGALPVIFRAQLVAVVATAPFGIAGIPASTFTVPAALAVVVLGVASSGIALVAMATLAGRVGADRGSIAVYFPPVVAILLGVWLRGESVAPLALVGIAAVLGGAWITARREGPRPQGVVPVIESG